MKNNIYRKNRWENNNVAVRVLIAEDEPNILESLRFILDREGWEVLTAEDGEEAMAFLRRHRPDIVVLDVMLPKVNGFEILKSIRADDHLRQTPVMILTAKGQEKDRKLAIEFGANLFVTKPYSNMEVVNQLKSLVANGQP